MQNFYCKILGRQTSLFTETAETNEFEIKKLYEIIRFIY